MAQNISHDGGQPCCPLNKRCDQRRDGLLGSIVGDGVNQAEKVAAVGAVNEFDPTRDLVPAGHSTAEGQCRFSFRITQCEVEFSDAWIIVSCELGDPSHQGILESVAGCFPNIMRARKQSLLDHLFTELCSRIELKACHEEIPCRCAEVTQVNRVSAQFIQIHRRIEHYESAGIVCNAVRSHKLNGFAVGVARILLVVSLQNTIDARTQCPSQPTIIQSPPAVAGAPGSPGSRQHGTCNRTARPIAAAPSPRRTPSPSAWRPSMFQGRSRPETG